VPDFYRKTNALNRHLHEYNSLQRYNH